MWPKRARNRFISAGDGPKVLNARQSLARHRFSPGDGIVPADGAEVADSAVKREIVFSTSATTRTLLLEAASTDQCPLIVDHLLLEDWNLRLEQEIALIQALPSAVKSEGRTSPVHRGRLLPLGSPSGSTLMEGNYTIRDALFAPAPTRMVFDVRVPISARLFFSYGLIRQSRPGDSVLFAITVEEEDGTTSTLFEQSLTVNPDGSEWFWHDAEIDLGRFGGRRVQLQLATSKTDGGRGLAVWGQPMIDVARSKGGPPNVIVIAVDTLRADRVWSADGREIKLPSIRRLAADGTRFVQTISQSTWTQPAFTSLFTGLLPSRHGSYRAHLRLATGSLTLASYLRESGWLTHAILYKPALYGVGLDQGFDSFFNVPTVQSVADQSLAAARSWLEKNRSRRFFLFLHFDDPHQPFNQPAAELSESQRRELGELDLELPIMVDDHSVDQVSRASRSSWSVTECRSCVGREEWLRAPVKRLAESLYRGEVRYADKRIGQFLDTLQEMDLYDDAWIIFLSDHGESLWDRGEFFGHGGFRYYDEILRVPLVIKPPRSMGLARGKIVASQVRLFDVMPTVLAAVGYDTSELGLQAESLLPMLSEGNREGEPRIALAESWRPGVLALRTDRWKYIRAPEPGEATRIVSEELYDLRDDPDELYDLADRKPDIVRSLRTMGLSMQLSDRPGRYVLVTGPGYAGNYRIVVRFERRGRVESIFGLSMGDTSKKGATFTGDSDDRLLVLASVEAERDQELSVTVSMLAPGTVDSARVDLRVSLSEVAPRFRAGDLARALAENRLSIYRFDNPPRTEAGARRIDPDLQAALRTLGYLE